MRKAFFPISIVASLSLAGVLPAFSQDAVAYPAPDKVCALTFDDGPDIVKTALVLDKLELHGVVASFFVVGQKINASTADVMKRAVALGCEIHNHSWSYGSLNNQSADQVKKSVDDTTAAIKEYAGVAPAFFRPPNLAVSATMYEAIDFPFASGILGFDWTGGGGNTPQKVADNVLGGIRDGAIILLHDVQSDPHPTPSALDILIPELKKRGYRFVSLTELFKSKNIDPLSRPASMWTTVP